MTKQIKASADNVKTMALGAKVLFKFLGELLFGVSFIYIVVRAGYPVWQTRDTTNELLLFVEVLPVVTMALTAAVVLGRYLTKLAGRKGE